MLIAFVWSFTDKTAPIPYQITRDGLPKAEGGDGVRWHCTCPHHTQRGVICKHLRLVWRDAAQGLVDVRVELTHEGRHVLRLDGTATPIPEPQRRLRRNLGPGQSPRRY